MRVLAGTRLRPGVGVRLSAARARGVAAASSLPAWFAGKAVNEWFQIPSTVAPDDLMDYCGLAWRIDATEVRAWSAAAGGHGGDVNGNSVETIRLDVDSPAWSTLRASDDSTGWSTSAPSSAYFPNGKPAPRHTYHDIWYAPEINRLVVGGRAYGSNAYDFANHDGFNLSTNDWDAAGTLANRAGAAVHLSVRNPATGIIYTTSGYKWDPNQSEGSRWSTFTLTGAPNVNRFTHAFDTLRSNIYHLSSGDSYAAGSSTISSATINISTGAKTAITLSGTGLTEFQNRSPEFLCASLTYDSDLDCFYFYDGFTGHTQKIWKITPNETTTWDITLLSVTGVTPAVSNAISGAGGSNGKFVYVPKFKACVMVAHGQSVYAIRVQ